MKTSPFVLTVLLAVVVCLVLIPGGIPAQAAPAQAANALESRGSPTTWHGAVGDDPSRATAALDSASVMFVENVGQFAEGARFQMRGGNGTIYLADNALWFTLLEKPGVGTRGQGDIGKFSASPQLPSSAPRKGVNLKLSFVGANAHPQIEPFNRLTTRVSYLLGSDPTKWHANVPVYGGVRYKDLYPGIDLEISGEGGQMSPRIVAQPGANLNAVQLRVDGADKVALLPSPTGRGVGGEVLQLSTAVGVYTLPLFQVAGAANAPLPQPNVVGLQVHAPFASAPLTNAYAPLAATDLYYSTFLGGADSDAVNDLAVTASGNAFVTGYTYSTDLPVTTGQTTFGGGFLDGFVAELDAAGKHLVYATFLGGSGYDNVNGLALDGSGNAYLTGSTQSANFPTTAGAYQRTLHGGACGTPPNTSYCRDGFVTKLDPTGASLLYSSSLGGANGADGYGIAVDGSGKAYVLGSTQSADFPTTSSAFQPTFGGGTCGSYPCNDAFVVKLSAAGQAAEYATYLGGSNYEGASGIALDGSGNAYVTGGTRSADFPTTTGAFQPAYSGGYDVFVTKLNAAGSAESYSTFLGSTADDYGYGLAVDSGGKAYVTGLTKSSDYKTTSGAFQTTFGGAGDGFVTKLNAAGSALVYSTFLGGNNFDAGSGIGLDASGNAYLTGSTESTNYPTLATAYQATFRGGATDAFMTELNAAGSALNYSTYLGGSGEDDGSGLAVDPSGNPYVAGSTSSTNFPITTDAFKSVLDVGDTDGFVTKFKLVTVPVPGAFAKTAPPTGATNQPSSLTLRWGTSSGASSYEYCYDTTNNSKCDSPWTSAGNNTSVTVSGLSYTTTYYWEVRALNAGGTTSANGGAWWSFATQVAAPAAFGKTAPENGATEQPTSVTLSWGASNGAASYQYCYSTTNSGSCASGWTSVGTNTSVTVSGLSDSTIYYWQVQAVNVIGTTASDSGAWWSFTTQLVAPGAFAKTAPANGATEQPTDPTLSWNASLGAASYQYCYDTTDDGSCAGPWTSAGVNTSVKLSGLDHNTTYYWQVQAVNVIGTTAADGDTWWSFTTQVPPPGDFAKTGPEDGATDQPPDLTLSWDASSGATGYEYCYDTTNDGSCASGWTSAGTNTSVDLSGLNYSTTYYWQVQAINAGGATSADNGTWWSFTTQLAAPGDFAKTAPANGATNQPTNPTLSWGASSGAASYQYCYSTTNDGQCAGGWTSVGANTSVSLSGLSYNTTYYWQVQAVNVIGTTSANHDAWWSLSTKPCYSLTTNVNPGGGGAVSVDPPNCGAQYIVGTTVTLTATASSGYRFDHWSGDASGSANPTTLAISGAESVTANLAPGDFSKTAPTNGASGQPTNPTLSWNANGGATSYQYCYSTTNTGSCAGSWIDAGTSTSVSLSGLSHNTTYYWQVQAVNAGGATAADGDAWWSFTTQVATPGAFVKTAPANGAIGQSINPTLSWGASSGATGYEYCYDTTNDGQCAGSWISAGTSMSATLSSLSYNTTYYWQVQAVNAGGATSADSGAAWSFTTQVESLGAFGKTAPTNGATRQSINPTLSWGASTNATSYEYCYDTTNDGRCAGGWTSTGASTSVDLSGLSYNTTYYWQVQAHNAAGAAEADGGAWWSFSTSACYSLTTNVNPGGGGAVSVDPPNCGAQYIVGTTVTLTATASSGYRFDHWSGDASGSANPTTLAISGAESVTANLAPGDFGKTAPTNGASGQPINPTLSWNANGGATSYQYCYSTTNNGSCAGSWTDAGTSTSVSLSGLSHNTTYYWQVQAVNAGGATTADSGAWWSFTTQVAAPGAFAKTAPANGAIGQSINPTLSWGASSGATGYEYCYDTTNDGSCTGSWISAGTAMSATLSGLSYNATYYWQVRAVNAGGATEADAGAWWNWSTLAWIEDTSLNILYNNWSGVSDSGASGGSYHVSKTTNNTVTFSFRGTAITWLTVKGPDQGKAQVLIDGVARPTADNYASAVQFKVGRTFAGMTNTAHTLTIHVLGTKNAKATAANVVVDGFVVGANPATEDTATAVKYNTWVGKANIKASGGTYRMSGTAGAIAVLKFTGPSITWLTAKGSSYGQAKVFIDGVQQGKVIDLYSAAAQWQVAIAINGLSNGVHTLKIQVLGTKNAKSSAANVVVDGFSGPITVGSMSAIDVSESDGD